MPFGRHWRPRRYSPPVLFSLSLPLLRDVSARDPYRQTDELAQLSAECGYDTVTVGHHHFMPGNLADPLTFLATVAARTDVLRVGTGIFQLPVHNPVRVAEQVATIDEMSGGASPSASGSAGGRSNTRSSEHSSRSEAR